MHIYTRGAFESLARIFFETQEFLKHLACTRISTLSEDPQSWINFESRAEELVTKFLAWKPSSLAPTPPDNNGKRTDSMID
ncbi:hypothetical protein K7432_001412 [Basidiobolus ranarum]|uniref:Uncharacterized protein n=1 Tax=Basidiobolus ranarum TaxID=34480 RepID=A0ABR2X335_9FUNG